MEIIWQVVEKWAFPCFVSGAVDVWLDCEAAVGGGVGNGLEVWDCERFDRIW